MCVYVCCRQGPVWHAQFQHSAEAHCSAVVNKEAGSGTTGGAAMAASQTASFSKIPCVDCHCVWFHKVGFEMGVGIIVARKSLLGDKQLVGM